MSDEETTHDAIAEQQVLAGCIESKLARAETKRLIAGGDFYDPRNEAIWDAMMQLDREGKPVDISSVMHASSATRGTHSLMLELMSVIAIPGNAAYHAETIREKAILRRLDTAAMQVQQRVHTPGSNGHTLSTTVANEFAAIRDSGVTDDISSKTLAEVLAEPDDEPDWLIPDLIERRDRLILTGDEGMGKSHLLRQFALSAAAGIDPWDATRHYEPAKVAIFDCENTEGQVRRAARGMAAFATHYGRKDAIDRTILRCSSRLDVTRDKDLAQIHHELDAQQPDLVVIGPMYRLIPRAIQTDDDAAPLLAALDTIRDRGIALLIEAHSGHAIGKGGNRDMRPRGSSALLGWPEFGYGMRDLGAKGQRYAAFVAWRGNRSERAWPHALVRANDGIRWIPYDGSTEVGDWGAA